jgi:tetratricopeptide (TPR) repeat protein
VTDQINITGAIFRTGPLPEAETSPDEGDRGVGDLSLLLDRAGSDTGEFPSVAGTTTLFRPSHSGLHSSLLSTSTRIGSAEAWQALAEELAEESQHIEDPDLRGAVLCEAGRILVDRLGRQEEGELLMRKSESPLASVLLDDGAGNVASLASDLAELEELAGDTSKDIDTRAAAWIEFGQLCEERASSVQRGLDAYARALELVEDHPVALALATDAAMLLEKADLARDLVIKRLELCEAPRLRAALLLDLADLVDDPLLRRKVLTQAHETDPKEETVLRRLIRSLSATDDLSSLGQRYRDLARISEDPVSANTALHLAFLTLVEAGEPVDSLVVELAERASEQGAAEDLLAPLAEVALHMEQRIAARDDTSELPENVAVLEPLARALDDPGEQALVREQLARTRLEILRRSRPKDEEASAGHKLEQKEHLALCEAIESDLRFCLMHMSAHRWTREALAEVLTLKPDIVGLVLHLQEWARLESAGPARATVLLRLGQVHEDLRDDLPRAGEVYELALAEEPDNTNCLRSLGRVYENMRRWPQAVATLQRQAKETEDETERLTILRRVALMAEQELHDVDLAVATLEEVARLDPDDLLSLYNLAALCRSHGRAPVLINTLKLLSDRADDDIARTGILVELGEVLELSLKQRNPARSCYERAIKLSPGYTPALRALSRLYRDAGDIEALLGLFSPEMDPITDPAVLALKAARVALEEAGDMERAIGLTRQAYEENPDLIPARDLLMELFMASDRIQEAYDLLRAQDLPRTPPLLADYHYRLGLLAERLARENEADRNQHEDAALQHYRASLIAQPDHGLALERARRLLVAYNDRDNLVHLAEYQAKHASTEARAVALVQLARLHACDDDSTEAARRAYEQATEAAPADALVRREYEGLLRRVQDHQSLPALYLTAARHSRDTHYRATLSVEAAELLLRSGAAEDREVAASAVLGALRDDPGNPYAVRHLERLLSAPGSSLAVKDAVGARAVRAQSEAERAIFYLESAELLERAGELEQARRAYHAAEDALPHLAPAAMGHARIASGRQVAAAATEVRTSVHVLMAEARDAAMRSGAGDQAAGQRAVGLVAEILGRDPHHRDAIALARALVGHLPDATPVLRLLATIFSRIEDASLRYELGLFLGEHAPRLEHTVRYYGAAAAARPDGKEALRGLINAYRQMGDQTRAAEATERLLQLFDPSEPAAIDLRIGLAAFLGENPSTLQRALAHARLVVQVRGEDPRAIAVMADLLERSGARAEAAQLIDRLIKWERDRSRQHDLHLRKAKMLATMPGQEAEALAAVEHAASISPGNRETITLLTELLDRTGQSHRVSAYLQPIRGALLANVSRGAVSLRDLRLLSHVASRTASPLAEMANLLLFAIEPTSTEPPAGHMRTASAAGLQQVLQTPALRSALYSSAEPPALHELFRTIEVVLERMAADFPILDPNAATPLPPSANPSSIAVLLRQWGDLLGLGEIQAGACAEERAVVALLGDPVELRLGTGLWARGDPAAWRGCAAIALARTALEAAKARSLSPVDMDLLLAACFETVEVFNPITADPDPRRLRELTIHLGKMLPRANRKAVQRACNSLASRAFDPATTARATLTTDLRLAVVMTGDVGGCLSAACLLDGVADGGLKQRINRSSLALELLVFLLSDAHLEARAIATS